MSDKVWPQPLIVVRDVVASSRFYADVLGLESSHGGDEYDQLVSDGEIVMQLHDMGVDDHHGPIAEADGPRGNGTLLWFEVVDFDATVARVRAVGAEIVRGPEVNLNAQQHEIWIRDPDGYIVVVAGPSEYRPRR